MSHALTYKSLSIEESLTLHELITIQSRRCSGDNSTSADRNALCPLLRKSYTKIIMLQCFYIAKAYINPNMMDSTGICMLMVAGKKQSHWASTRTVHYQREKEIAWPLKTRFLPPVHSLAEEDQAPRANVTGLPSYKNS